MGWLRHRRRTAGPVDRETADPAARETADPAASALVEITDENFMAATEGGYTIVDCWAAWCAPCHQFAPIFTRVAAEYGDRIRFGALNVDDALAAAALLQVRSIPTVVVFGPDGSEIGRAQGVLPAPVLRRLCDEVLAQPGPRA